MVTTLKVKKNFNRSLLIITVALMVKFVTILKLPMVVVLFLTTLLIILAKKVFVYNVLSVNSDSGMLGSTYKAMVLISIASIGMIMLLQQI